MVQYDILITANNDPSGTCMLCGRRGTDASVVRADEYRRADARRHNLCADCAYRLVERGVPTDILEYCEVFLIRTDEWNGQTYEESEYYDTWYVVNHRLAQLEQYYPWFVTDINFESKLDQLVSVLEPNECVELVWHNHPPIGDECCCSQYLENFERVYPPDK